MPCKRTLSASNRCRVSRSTTCLSSLSPKLSLAAGFNKSSFAEMLQAPPGLSRAFKLLSERADLKKSRTLDDGIFELRILLHFSSKPKPKDFGESTTREPAGDVHRILATKLFMSSRTATPRCYDRVQLQVPNSSEPNLSVQPWIVPPWKLSKRTGSCSSNFIKFHQASSFFDSL